MEDDADMRWLLRKVLVQEGYSVIARATGKGALAALRRVHLDLILLAMTLPDMSGLRVVRRARRIHPRWEADPMNPDISPSELCIWGVSSRAAKKTPLTSPLPTTGGRGIGRGAPRFSGFVVTRNGHALFGMRRGFRDRPLRTAEETVRWVRGV